MWDLAIVGAGPAGAAAALGALRAEPGLSVALLDRAHFPRDKPCGDGIAPHVLDLLAEVDVHDLLADRTPVRRLELRFGGTGADRQMRRPAWVVPRRVFDARLVTAAASAGATLLQHRARRVDVREDSVLVDEAVRARVLVGADGAHSVVRAAAGLRPAARRALALRGYAAPTRGREGRQIIVFADDRQPSYAWSFDRGDGLANVGYGELLRAGRAAPSRRLLLERLELLLPGATQGGTDWRGHHLPLSASSWPHPDGRLLLAGDAAGLVNPLTGEGIYYAVATGILAGRAAAEAVVGGNSGAVGAAYRRQVRALLGRHLRHTAAASRLVTRPTLLEAGVQAAGSRQGIFDDLVEMGLGRGRITPRLAAGVLASLPAAQRMPLRLPGI